MRTVKEKLASLHAGDATEARTCFYTKHFVGPEEKPRHKHYHRCLPSQRGRLLRSFHSTAFHRFGLLRRAQFDCQEQIIAEETTQNTFENPAVHEQVIVHEIHQAARVVDSFPPIEEFVAPHVQPSPSGTNRCDSTATCSFSRNSRGPDFGADTGTNFDVLAPAVTHAAPSQHYLLPTLWQPSPLTSKSTSPVW